MPVSNAKILRTAAWFSTLVASSKGQTREDLAWAERQVELGRPAILVLMFNGDGTMYARSLDPGEQG